MKENTTLIIKEKRWRRRLGGERKLVKKCEITKKISDQMLIGFTSESD